MLFVGASVSEPHTSLLHSPSIVVYVLTTAYTMNSEEGSELLSIPSIHREEHNDVLQHHHLQFRQSLNFQALHPYLNKYGLIPLDHQNDFIPALPPVTSNDQIDRLLVWLPHCGQPDYIHKFIQCLRESSDDAGDAHSELADTLQEYMKQNPRGTDVPPCLNWRTVNGCSSPDSIVESPMETDGFVTTLVPLVDIKKKQWYIAAVNKRKKGRKCCSAKWVGCYVTLSLPVVLSLILLIILSQVPATDNIIHPGIAVQNDTVELQFNLPVWWLSGVTLEIKNTCAGKVFSTKGTACGALATVVEYLHENFDTLIYMLPTSVIYFNIPENSKTLLWIFSDNDLYLQYLDQPQQFDCAAVPPKSVCVNTSQHFGSFQYNVTNAGYISIACDDAGTFSPCFSEGLRWYFERYLYNYREIVSQYEPVATLNERRGSEVIHFNSLFNFQPFCVLLHIDADSCTSPPHEKWNVLNVRKREDILLFPGIISLIFISFIPCLAVFHWVRTRRSG